MYEIGQGCESPITCGSDGVEGVLSTIYKNYFAQMCKQDDTETKKIEIATVGAGLGDGYNHTDGEIQGSYQWTS